MVYDNSREVPNGLHPDIPREMACFVVCCDHKPNSTILHKIPTDLKVRSLWVSAIYAHELGCASKVTVNTDVEKVLHRKVCEEDRVCSDHFLSTDYLSLDRPNTVKVRTYSKLKTNAVPSVFHRDGKDKSHSTDHCYSKKLSCDHSCASTNEVSAMYTAVPYDTYLEQEIQRRKPEMFSTQCQTPAYFMHSGVKKKSRDFGTQTDEIPVEEVEEFCEPRLVIPPRDLSFNTTFSSFVEDDTRDADWTPDVSINEDNDVQIAPDKERKFIVFESELDKLLNQCKRCGADSRVTKKLVGSCLICDLVCQTCCETSVWQSQPMSGQLPFGNLILCAAMLFSAVSPGKLIRMFNFAKIQCVSVRTYHTIQSLYLVPSVESVWQLQQNDLTKSLRDSGQAVTAGGDARCCSPGHTAKYGSYTVMDLDSSKILDIQLVQSNEVKNSYAMELEGLKRCLSHLDEEHVQVQGLVTDRHSSVKKYMREQRPEITHWFDVWHMAKGVYKKLEAAGKKKGCEKVALWARSISNHMYWCAASSNGDGALVKAKWTSILNHVADIHEGHDQLYPECLHEPVQRNWVRKGYKPYAEIEKVVSGRMLLSDIGKMSPHQQTSSLESFHSLVNSFATKALHFHHPQMEARLFLAGLHWNENCGRQQGVTQAGTPMYRISYSKSRKGEGVASEVKTEQTYEYVEQLMAEVVATREHLNTYSRAKRQRELSELGREYGRPLPISQSTPKRPRAEIILAHTTRFNR